MKKDELRIAIVEFALFGEFRKTERMEFRDYVELSQYITERLRIYVDAFHIHSGNIRALVYLNGKNPKNKKCITLKK